MRIADFVADDAIAASAANDDGGFIHLKTGAPPASFGGSQGTLLGNLTLDSPAFGSPTNGLVYANTITPATALADGDVGHYVMFDSGGNKTRDGNVGVSGSGADMIIGNTSIQTGGTISIGNMSLTQPQT